MSQSLVANYVHIVFSTKHRARLIKPEIETELYKYMGGICKNNDCIPVGYVDHVHISCSLSKKNTVMKLVEQIKAYSSKWIKGKGNDFATFYWQSGYGAFSVGWRDLERTILYIENQHQHHRGKAFQKEYLEMLEEREVTYNEKYLWD